MSSGNVPVWERAIRYGCQLISDTLPRLHHIAPRTQDESRAVTHYGRDNAGLGNRSDRTRGISAAST